MPIAEAVADSLIHAFYDEFRGLTGLKIIHRPTQEHFYGTKGSIEVLGYAIKGAFLPRQGHIHLALANFHNEGDFRKSLQHEALGHYGTLTFREIEKRNLLEVIIASRQSPSMRDDWEMVDKAYAGQSELMKAEEVFCLAAERISGPPSKTNAQASRIWSEVVTNKVRPLERDDLQTFVDAVADGIRCGTRVQRIFPVDDESQFRISEPQKQDGTWANKQRIRITPKEDGTMTNTVMNAAVRPTEPRKEITLHELVIPDLKQMDATGKFDRNVLLWLQDAYVAKAMKENTGELVNYHRELAQTNASDEDRRLRRTEFLTKITTETYSTAKFEGGGFNLKEYVEAAKTFYESESELYAGHLGELAEYIKKSMDAGVKPDIERFAREAYVCMARMSGAIENLENLGALGNAQKMAAFMKKGINDINFAVVTTPGQPVPVGRELLKVVDQISKAPEKYIQYVAPYKFGMPKASPWDFEPERRSDNGPSIG